MDDYLANFSRDFRSPIRASARSIVADAETALVHILSPAYNDEKYLSYPRSEDGLHGHSFNRYCVAVAIPLELRTNSASLSGDSDPELGYCKADAIVVENGAASITKLNDSKYAIVRPARR